VDYEFQLAEDHAGNRMMKVQRGQIAAPPREAQGESKEART
jgi:hypothetical protein